MSLCYLLLFSFFIILKAVFVLSHVCSLSLSAQLYETRSIRLCVVRALIRASYKKQRSFVGENCVCVLVHMYDYN